ncbi:MAG: SDR family NAD(P)-dependent oxidoreductase [Desulforhopalus sp.]
MRNRFYEQFPGVKLLNDYSISECHDVCTHDLEHLDPLYSPKYASLGLPMDNVRIYLLDENLEPVPVGMSAEIYIGGDSLARGYLDDPEKTAERFIPDPVRKDGSRLFRTGDLGRFLPNGELEVKGRVEFMVKLRGYSIVPGAVEAAISEHEDVNTSVVVAKNNDETGQPEALVAYVVGSGSMDGDTLGKILRPHLKERLPHYAIPSIFIPLEELPLHDVTGKLDRKKLPDPEEFFNRKRTARKAVLPEGNLATTIMDSWEEILKIRATDLEDNFFDMGGHSLLAIKACDKLSTALGVEVSVIDIYENPTVQSLADFISSKREDAGLAFSDNLVENQTVPAGGSTEVAVVGIAARFPGAGSVREFWDNLVNGVCSIRELSEEELAEKGIPEAVYKDPDYRRVGAVLDDVDKFDYKFFGLSKKEADLMDPQHRIFLECCWEAMENAGYPPTQDGKRTGVFGGCYSPLYLLHNLKGGGFMDPSDPADFHLTETGNDKDYLATRVSYHLNLQGPSISVQTSCSTAASVVASACESLLAGKCDTALAGAASITFPQGGYQYVEGHINSKEGKIMAFDAGADGTILGDGVGVIVLKRLEDALQAGDNIVSVIKGFAVNNDGSDKAGYSAPSVHGQKDMVVEALNMAGVGAGTISYMEAHGTGTLIGDPIEIRALSDVYRSFTEKKTFCALGSVKPNIGHSNIASGMAGIIKASLSLYHRQIPPTIHFNTPNPSMNIEDSPFFINTELREWVSPGKFPRRAGVSCLGIGGTNVHFVLEEPPVRAGDDLTVSPRDEVAPARHILALSAKTLESLEAMRQEMISFLADREDCNLRDLEYTLQEGREVFPVRLAVSCTDRSSALAGLKTAPAVDSQNILKHKTAFLFPGQGSQHNRMGMDLYRADPVYRKYFDLCCDKLTQLIGVDLRTSLFGQRGTEKAEEPFRYAYYTQPAIFSVQYSLARSLMERGVIPEALAGHSIGEYSAACIAGVLSLDDALTLVVARGRVMEEAGEGAMTAVGLPPADGERFLEGRKDISLGVINGDNQIVLSGTVVAVQKAEEDLEKQGVACQRVNVKQAFHSAMMDSAAEKLVKEAEKVSLRKPQIPLLSNLTGTWMTERDACNPGYWGRHMRGTVRFADNVKALLKEKTAVMLEVGSHKLLTKLMKNLAKGIVAEDSPMILSTMRHPKDAATSDTQAFGQALGNLWAAGLPVDLKSYRSAESKGRKIAVPGISFDRYRCWQDGDTRWNSTKNRKGKIKDLADRGYIPSWTRNMLETDLQDTHEEQAWLIFSDPDREELSVPVAEILKSRGDTVRIVVPSRTEQPGRKSAAHMVNPSIEEHFSALLADLEQENVYPGKILYFWSITAEGVSEQDELGDVYYTFLNLAKSLAGYTGTAPLSLWVFTDRTFQIDSEPVRPVKSTLLGPTVVLPQENPLLTCHVVDIQQNRIARTRLVDQILRECTPDTPATEPFIALRGVHRWVQRYEPVRLAPPVYPSSCMEKGGVYIITGGLGRIGRALAEKLGREGGSLVLTTSRELPVRGDWHNLLSSGDLSGNLHSALELLTDLDKNGYPFEVVKADLSRQEDVSALLDTAVNRFGKITGIFHAAGTADLQPLEEIDERISEKEFGSKVYALWNLEKAVGTLRHKTGKQPRFIMLFSSMASILGGYNMAAYAGANRFMDTFAQSRSLSDSPSWIAVNWDDWDFEYSKEQVGAYEKTTAQFAMSPDEGVETIHRILSLQDPSQVLVATRPVEQRVTQWLHQNIQEGEERESLSIEEHSESGGLEERIANVFRDVLGVPDLVSEDNFFDAGGDSLLASRILLKLRRNLIDYADKITLNSIFDYPSVKELSGWLDG